MDIDDVVLLLQRNGSQAVFMIRLKESNFLVSATIGEAKVLNLGVSPPRKPTGNYSGLLGNFDGNKDNDLMLKSGVLRSL